MTLSSGLGSGTFLHFDSEAGVFKLLVFLYHVDVEGSEVEFFQHEDGVPFPLARA